ncbi:hypothetical protein SteCoe_14721 [Stentor coeruleus]|uniref:Casein kinase I n=1 Tax=Stentor coeruleus TaxID=5963 RepID=A0A1R2C5E2_9CILI|nr:hypothetical protein SteCoe_14721 [Stentor coeruleus]
MDEDKVINHRYQIQAELGKGGYGQVFKVLDLVKRFDVALKIDINSKGSVLQEAKILKELQGGEGIPKLYDTGKTPTSTYMVIQILGPSLSLSLKTMGSYNINTVTLIMLQAISRIEYVHSKGYIHRDIKPQQFLIGPQSTLYLVDFGIAKKFIIDNCHISFQSQCSRVGSCSYASINSHIGIRLSRRDDFESLVYMGIFLIRKFLPWFQDKRLDDNRKWSNAFQIKRDISEQDLFHSCPKQFAIMLSYIRSLKFEERPDYEYLRELINSIRNELSLTSTVLGLNFVSRKPYTVIVKKNEDELKKLMDSSHEEMKSHNKRRPKKSRTLIGHNKNNDLSDKFLKIPTMKESRYSISGNVSGSSTKPITQNEETIRNIYPEFTNRKKLFNSYNSFKSQFRSNSICKT